jgi:hypothetical protein
LDIRYVSQIKILITKRHDMAEWYDVDGTVRLAPEKDIALREGLEPWLGNSILSVTVNRLPLVELGDGCFGWKPHPDCTDNLQVLAYVELPGGKTSGVMGTFRRNNRGEPWPIDARGLPHGVLDLLSELATARHEKDSWYDRQLLEAPHSVVLQPSPRHERVSTNAYTELLASFAVAQTRQEDQLFEPPVRAAA